MKFAPARAIVAIALITLACSCRKSPEGETKKWERNVAKAKEAITLHPSFSAVLNTELSAAEAAMEAASTETDAKLKTKKMSEANQMLSGGALGLLSKAERELKELRSSMISAPSKAVDEADRMAINQALQMGQAAVTKVEAALKTGATDASQAQVILKNALSELSTADSGIDRAVAAARKKAKAQSNTAKPVVTSKPTTGTGSTKPTSTPTDTRWKCSYCGAKNSATANKCPGCAASRP